MEHAGAQGAELAVAHGAGLIDIAFVIVVAVTAGLVLMRLRQPPMVGFILSGVALGPTGLGVIDDSANVSALAEMGVLLLLFFIGMEISLKAFVQNLKPAIQIAGGQLLAAMAISFGLMAVSTATLAEAIILGFIIALSSTVVAMKMLDDIGELRTDVGRITVGVLIAQDIAVVPMLILATALGGEGEIAWAGILVKIVVAVGILAGLLRYLGRRGKLRMSFGPAVEENVEMLALGSIAFCFAAASISGVAGLSPAYGAFIAGLVVGASTLRARVIPVIEPIQSVLLFVFFLSIGLLIDLAFITENWVLVLVASLFVIVAKTVFNVVLTRLAGFEHKVAMEAGLAMAQIGEFSFIIAAAAFASGAIGGDVYRLAIAVTAVTLLVSPAWMILMRRIEGEARFGIAEFRHALAEIYEGQVENVGRGYHAAEDGWLWIRIRSRAIRRAWRRRRQAKREAAKLAVAARAVPATLGSMAPGHGGAHRDDPSSTLVP